MDSPTRSDWRSTVRTVAFALMAAAVLLGIALGGIGRAASLQPAKARQGRLLKRAGDTMMQIFYLARTSPHGLDPSDLILAWATDFYEAAYEMDPADFHIALSATIVNHARGDYARAERQLPRVRTGQFDSETMTALRYVNALIVAQHPAPEAIEHSREYLLTLPVGPLLLAGSYRSTAAEHRSAEALAAGAKQAHSLLPALWTVAVVNGGILLAGPALLIATFIRRRTGAPSDGGHPEPIRGPALREASEAIVLWVFASVVLGSLAQAFAPPLADPPFLLVLAPNVLAYLPALLWVWIASPRRFRFGWSRALTAAGIGVGAAGLAMAPALAVNNMSRWLAGQSPLDNPIVPLLVQPQTLAMRALVVAAVGALIPALEETLFRGVLFGALRRQMSFWPAALASAAVFAVAHLDLAGIAALFGLGVLFALLLERTRSLFAPWAAHAAFNIFNLAIIFLLFG